MPEKRDFVKMILLDSIFIIELFLRTATRQEYEKDDYILSKPWLDEGIKHYLILLENQLPFFILDELHHHIGRSTSLHKSFINLACNYFFPGDQKKPIEKEVKHFTDLQRYFYLPRNLETGNIIEHLHSATKLDTGIEIPEDLFRNLMALEQCHYPFEAYICNYIVLLDFLINTREDAELLVEKKIIAHSLGSYKAVAQMVNKLSQEIVEKNSCYHDVAKDLNEHYGNWWNKNIASLRTVYFRDVWRGTATFVGIDECERSVKNQGSRGESVEVATSSQEATHKKAMCEAFDWKLKSHARLSSS
ncbi:UPF0481 protein At3g47200-like [Quercus lobata]|uniref:UPF0481 protein At3g47200-like n=1 Tax=Quercus lobata TaxID=97700 RepID=UPI001248923A|nr:UPF0481 protein At3g47200-like [Quercus lobata]